MTKPKLRGPTSRQKKKEFRPTTVWPKSLDPSRPPTRYWMIDGHRKLRRLRDDKRSRTSVESRELLDVETRLRHMDELGIAIQVIYPTLFLVEPAHRPEAELSLTRSYNRWLAERCALSQGRLRWICVLPMRTIDRAIEEVRFAKDHGACGILKKGDMETGRPLGDPYFFPLYEEAERLNLPLCFHTGSGTPVASSREDPGTFLRMKAPVLNAVHAIVQDGIAARFPQLRFACVEAGASWAPMVNYGLRRSAERFPQSSRAMGRTEPDYEVQDDVFKANRIYVTCQVDEDLGMLLNYISEDNLLLGSDYSHEDQSQEHGFLRLLQERADRGEIPQSAVSKILYENPRTLYGL